MRFFALFFRWVLGQFFLWAGLTAWGCVAISHRGLRRERQWWAQRASPVAMDSTSGNPSRSVDVS